MRFQMINTREELMELVDTIGFLPFFQNEIEGFSVEECTPYELWFETNTEGPWEWREELAQSKSCIYGKFFHKKTGLISREWFPDFANYRRQGYDVDARWDDGLASYKDKQIVNLLERKGACMSPQLRKYAGIEKGTVSWFETSMTNLQMQTYVLPCDFHFHHNKDGFKTGYGTAEFDIAEKWLGDKLCKGSYGTQPEQSFEKIKEQMKCILSDIDEAAIIKLIK